MKTKVTIEKELTLTHSYDILMGMYYKNWIFCAFINSSLLN